MLFLGTGCVVWYCLLCVGILKGGGGLTLRYDGNYSGNKAMLS